MASLNEERPSGIGVLPLAAGLTTTLVLAYLTCWLAVLLPNSAAFAHQWLALFSAEPTGSVAQLIEGLIYSAVSAWFASLVFAPVYNLVARADRVI